MLVYLNGDFVPKDEAKVSVFDHGYLYGDGIYETMRAYDGVLFLLDRHLERLQRSADLISLTLPLPLNEIAHVLNESVKRNNLKEAYVRIQVSRGPGEIGLDPALCPRPTMVVTAKAFKDYPSEYYEKGVSVAIVKTRRNHPLALDPAIKATNFLNNILAKIESLNAGAYEGIMLNWKGQVAEGTISNIFCIKSGILRTPDVLSGILSGVTRRLVLDLAGACHIPIEEAAMLPVELVEADECFITNSTCEIMPVTSIDRKPVGDGRPGPVTASLHKEYQEEVRRCLRMQPS